MLFTTCTRSPTAQVHREAKLNLRGDFIAVGHRHFAHVIAETAHFQMTGILFETA